MADLTARGIVTSSNQPLETSLDSLLPQGWEEMPAEALEELLSQLKEKYASASALKPQVTNEFQKYQLYPEKFVKEVLGQSLTQDQAKIAYSVRDNPETGVKAGHSVGKTFAAAGVAIWFLHVYDPAIVVTTAPSAEIVQNEIWREMRRQMLTATVKLLPGIKDVRPFWDVSAGRYAQGISTDKGERFRGKHCENMLFILDEGQGLPRWAFVEAEAMSTATNNKILVLGNPIDPTGPYYDCFKPNSGFHQITLSCLDHPNVVSGREIYRGAVTRDWVEKRIRKYCQRLEPCDVQEDDFEWPRDSGIWYRPDGYFRARVLGQFADEGPDSLISLRWVHDARERRLPIDPTAPIDIGADIAYAGGDYCVLFARRGPSLIARRKWRGKDPEKCLNEIGAFVKEYNDRGERVGTVAVDAIGIGSGVAYGLIGMMENKIIRCDRVIPVQVSEKATDSERYANRRADLSFALAERFRTGQIDLSRLGDAAEDFESQAIKILTKRENRTLRLMIESKDEIRKRTGQSCDDFDAMMLCFIDTVDTFADNYADLIMVA